MYGPGVQARQILIARRLVERGVRFVQVWHGEGQPWDSHDDIEKNHRRLAKQCDQAIGALLKDLKQRGLLEDTLVIWGGEFGRTPTVELPKPGSNAGKINGRDHNHYGFTMWLAGGGVKGGYVHGATDEFGFQAVEKRVHVHDLHATLLQAAGLRSREVHLPLRRPRFPPDRRARAGGAGVDRVRSPQRKQGTSPPHTPLQSRSRQFKISRSPVIQSPLLALRAHAFSLPFQHVTNRIFEIFVDLDGLFVAPFREPPSPAGFGGNGFVDPGLVRQLA